MLKMDSHIHSEYSPDSNSKIDDILKTAQKENIDIIAISDHNTVDGTSLQDGAAALLLGTQILHMALETHDIGIPGNGLGHTPQEALALAHRK